MNIFKHIQVNKPRGSKFDLSHEKKMSIKQGKLYPMLVQEIVPGDHFRVNSEIMLRMAPMIAPVMHHVNVHTHFFFVPNRLVWNEWEDFITGGEDGLAEPVFPTILINDGFKQNFGKGSLADYLNIPAIDPGDILSGNTPISAIPFRMYQLIYNEFFRDQNLEEKVVFSKGSGQTASLEVTDLTTLRKRAWEKDYFTSALPWAQRGGEAQIPLGTIEPLYKTNTNVFGPDGIGDIADGDITSLSSVAQVAISVTNPTGGPAQIHNLEPMDVDPVTINDLRKATKLQVWLEKSARGGARYIEQIWSHFKVKSSDARLQRPEYLGGGKQPVVISEVLNTTGVDGQAPQGDMAGHGISVGSSNRFSKGFEEHGYIIGLISVLPRTAYQNGIENHWRKFDKFDFFWPEFANLGEQEIKVSEIYCDFNDDTALTRVFGYQQRYAEYKYNQSTVHGDFRDTLAFWQMGRIFDTEPVLNAAFVQSDPTTRIFAVDGETEDTMYVQIYNNISAMRPMPYFSIPEL